MKVFAALALFLAGLVPVHADTITTTGFPLIIPDGSQVTALLTFSQDPFDPGLGVDFSFTGGTGTTWEFPRDGSGGEITFTSPVTNLDFIATLGGSNYGILSAGGFSLTCGYFLPSQCSPDSFEVVVNGPVSSISWGSDQNSSGIEAMSFTDPPPVSTPEPNGIVLLLIGLLGLGLRARIVRAAS